MSCREPLDFKGLAGAVAVALRSLAPESPIQEDGPEEEAAAKKLDWMEYPWPRGIYFYTSGWRTGTKAPSPRWPQMRRSPWQQPAHWSSKKARAPRHLKMTKWCTELVAVSSALS